MNSGSPLHSRFVLVGEIQRDFVGVFNNTIIPLALVGYEMIIANSALRASLAIYHLISNAPSWSNLADLAKERERRLTTARANQTTGLTNGRATNWTPEVVFAHFPVVK